MRLGRLARVLLGAALACAGCDAGGPPAAPGALAPAGDPWVERAGPGELCLHWPAAWTQGAVAVRTAAEPARPRLPARIGLRVVCDLRSSEERAAAPDRLPDPAPEVAALPIEDAQLGAGAIRDRLLRGALSQAEAERLLVDGNVAFATRFRERYAALFERLLADGALPALVHCTAGKDRAGFAAALVLLAVGVPEEQVMDDYLATNAYTAEATRRRLRAIRLVSLFRTSPAEARPLLEARRGYLEAGLEAARAGWGGVDAYLERALGLTSGRASGSASGCSRRPER